jgi:putative ABC transport system substrate-binding protein
MRVFMLLVAALALMAVTPPSLAQEQQKLVRVAMVRGGNPGPDPVREAFVEGMRALGYVEGRNIVYEFRYAAGNDAALLRQHMHDIVHMPVDIIVTAGTPAGLAASAATPTIPIVLSGLADPVVVGLAASMARPGGNVTGFTNHVEGGGIEAERIVMLKEIMPGLRRIGLLHNPNNRGGVVPTKAMAETARVLGIAATVFEARRAEDVEPVFEAMGEAAVEAVAVEDDATLNANRALIAAQAERRRLPLVCGFREFAQAGCLLSYAVDYRDNARRAAGYVDKILKGATPGELPFQQPIKFDLLINMKTAKMLGITVPAIVMIRANEVIE